MAQGRGISAESLDTFRGGLTPFERAGRQALSREPRAFNYSELEQTFPTRQVRPLVPAYIQRELDEQELERKAAEIEVRRREAQLNIYDSQLNQERERLRQVPLARQALSQLDPSDPDFILKLSDIQNQFPLASEDTQVNTYLVNPLLRRHESIQQNNSIIQRGMSQRQESQRVVSEDEFQKAAGLLSDELFSKQIQEDLKTETPEGKIRLLRAQVARDTINRFSQQQGVGVQAPTLQDEMGTVPTGEMSFTSEEEAMASGLPSGTIVIINGRKARID